MSELLPPKNTRFFSPMVSVAVCLVMSVIIGTTAWIAFGSGSKVENRDKMAGAFAKKSEPKPVETTAPSPKTVTAPAPATATNLTVGNLNLVPIEAGESVIGGEGTDIPLTNQAVEAFNLGETEVTNNQYFQYVTETGVNNPGYWKSNELADELKNTPVVNVSHKEAGNFCGWLGKKLNGEGRLPTEFEWEYAARGKEHLKYSWGNEPNSAIVDHNQPLGQLKAVKFYPENRSPFGVFDMAGSVWEWTNTTPSPEELKANKNRAALAGKNLKILKGSSLNEKIETIFPGRREIVPSDIRDMSIGFRCVVIVK